MGSPDLQYPEKAASPSSPTFSSPTIIGPATSVDENYKRRRLALLERRELAMATIQNDDERLLTRIGYKQVCISKPKRFMTTELMKL